MASSAMTMRDMDLYMESKGYIVDRQYDTTKQEYKFTISDGSFKKTYWWKYDRKTGAKKEAADNMLKDFVKTEKLLAPFNKPHSGLWGDMKHGYEYVEDLSSIDKMIKYVEREGDFDEVIFDRDPIRFEGSFALRKGNFHMTHWITLSRTLNGFDSFAIKLELDNMIEKFNKSKLNNTYIKEDIAMGYGVRKEFIIPELNNRKLTIKDVIFNAPATIVFWSDGTKTVVKAQNDDVFDKEKGLAMAITKKFFGNKGNYYNQVVKWLNND